MGQSSCKVLKMNAKPVQVENPMRRALHTAVLVAPATQQRYRIGVKAADSLPTPGPQNAAVRMRGSLWRRRPAGVLCVEKLELAVAPIALCLEHLYLLELHAAVTAAMGPLSTAAPTTR